MALFAPSSSQRRLGAPLWHWGLLMWSWHRQVFLQPGQMRMIAHVITVLLLIMIPLLVHLYCYTCYSWYSLFNCYNIKNYNNWDSDVHTSGTHLRLPQKKRRKKNNKIWYNYLCLLNEIFCCNLTTGWIFIKKKNLMYFGTLLHQGTNKIFFGRDQIQTGPFSNRC